MKRPYFSIFLIISFITTTIKILPREQQQIIINNKQLLQKYPELLEKVFGTTNVVHFATPEYINSKFKNLVLESQEFSKIVAASVIAAIAYGIIQDQVTARICLEYFSQGFHKKMMDTWTGTPILNTCRSILLNSNSPTVHALLWGTIATWWVGLPLGVLLAGASRIGPWPKTTLEELIKPLMVTMNSVGIATLVAGIYGYFANKGQFNKNINSITDDITKYKFTAGAWEGVRVINGLNFIVNTYAHSTSYTAAAIGGIVLIKYVLYKRYQKNKKKLKYQLI